MALVEVVVAVVVLAITMLAAGQAMASALRLGAQGVATARLAAALEERMALLAAATRAGTPCGQLLPGASVNGRIALQWRAVDTARWRTVRLEGRHVTGARVVADTAIMRLDCP